MPHTIRLSLFFGVWIALLGLACRALSPLSTPSTPPPRQGALSEQRQGQALPPELQSEGSSALGTLPPEGCPQNLGKIVLSYDPRDQDGVHYGIYVMNSDGSQRIRLSEAEARNDRMPAWSPERCRIAFVRFTKEGRDDIYVMTADGKSIQRLTTHPAADTFPDWSPDGRQIAFISDRDGYRHLYIMNADGSDPRPLTTQALLPVTKRGYVQWPQWSPKGDEIAFIYNPGTEGQGTSLYVIRPDGSGLRQIDPRGEEVAWSPDGNKLYFFANYSGQVEIWVIQREGGGLKQISNLYAALVFPDHSLRVSPDGKWLAFYAVGPEVAQYGTEVYIIRTDGSGLQNISHAVGQDEWLDW